MNKISRKILEEKRKLEKLEEEEEKIEGEIEREEDVLKKEETIEKLDKTLNEINDDNHEAIIKDVERIRNRQKNIVDRVRKEESIDIEEIDKLKYKLDIDLNPSYYNLKSVLSRDFTKTEDFDKYKNEDVILMQQQNERY